MLRDRVRGEERTAPFACLGRVSCQHTATLVQGTDTWLKERYEPGSGIGQMQHLSPA